MSLTTKLSPEGDQATTLSYALSSSMLKSFLTKSLVPLLVAGHTIAAATFAFSVIIVVVAGVVVVHVVVLLLAGDTAVKHDPWDCPKDRRPPGVRLPPGPGGGCNDCGCNTEGRCAPLWFQCCC